MLKLKLRAITIFEVIMAIIVFGTGVLVILSMLTKNISRLRDIKHKDTATLLAKEGLEIVYNLRDTNTDKGIVRNCIEYQTGADDNNCANYFHESNTGQSYFQVDRSNSMTYNFVEITGTSDSWLYYHEGDIETSSGVVLWPGFWYNHNATGGSITDYRRYILFRPVSDYSDNTGNILAVESHVEYEVSNTTKNVTLESLIGQIRY